MLVTPDDFERLKERILEDGGGRIGGESAALVFDRLVADIEPRLVITEPGGAAEWFEIVIRARYAVRSDSRGISPGMLDRVGAVASKYMKLGGEDPQRRFAFMRAPDLRRVAEADWTRLVAAGRREDAKTAAIAAGSVVEAVALDILERLPEGDIVALRNRVNAVPENLRKIRGVVKGRPTKWLFAAQLLAIGPDGLSILSETTHDIGHQLRDWRNYVHPHVARAEPPLTAADGRLAAGFAEKVIEEIEAWHVAGDRLVVPP